MKINEMSTAGTPPSDWRLYERMAAAIEAENIDAGIDLSIGMNIRLVGAISGIGRQVDMLIEARWEDDRSRRILVDAKRYGRPLNVKDVEAFEGMMRDCQAQHGVLVCSNGWSPGAARRAQDGITLKMLSVEDAEEKTDWAMFEACYGHCWDTRDPSRRGVVLWDAQLPLELNEMYAIIWTGKCDTCHNFQVWCWDCGETLSLGLDEAYSCGCERWWSSKVVEEAGDAIFSSTKAVHLVLAADGVMGTIDRRSLSSAAV